LPHSRKPASPGGHPLAHELFRVLFEALLVVGIGLGLAWVANGLSPRGLLLGRDYFPREHPAEPAVAGVAPMPVAANPAPPASTGEVHAIRARLESLGLGWVGTEDVARLYADPRRVEERIIFVDARNDANYQSGHVPGAYPFDRYYPETQLPGVLPACQTAEVIVVYCAGGDCEDSEFAALALRDAGIPGDRLRVYGGGMHEWVAQGLPVETGPRGSGILQEPRHE
jgi:rhodanese-related sulfurtransferase